MSPRLRRPGHGHDHHGQRWAMRVVVVAVIALAGFTLFGVRALTAGHAADEKAEAEDKAAHAFTDHDGPARPHTLFPARDRRNSEHVNGRKEDLHKHDDHPRGTPDDGRKENKRNGEGEDGPKEGWDNDHHKEAEHKEADTETRTKPSGHHQKAHHEGEHEEGTEGHKHEKKRDTSEQKKKHKNFAAVAARMAREHGAQEQDQVEEPQRERAGHPEEGTARPANHVGAWRGATVARTAHRPCLVTRCPRREWTQFTHWDSCDSVERLADAVKQPAGAKAILPAAARRQGFDVGRAEFFVRPEVSEGDQAGFGQRSATEQQIDKRCDHGEHSLRERLEGCVDPRYPLRLPLAVHHLTVGADLAAYGRGDLVSDIVGRSGGWEAEILEILTTAAAAAKKTRRQQLAAHHAALLKHYGLAADDVPLPAAAAEGSFDVEFYDIGGNVGAFALSMQQHGYPTKVFEALPQNMQLLSTSKCLNGIRTSFFGPNGTAVPLVATEAGQDEPPLSPSVERAGRGDPLRLFHVALGEAADQRCVMLSTPLNFGDTFISCNRSHVESTSDTPLDDYVRRGYVEMTTADRVLHFGADDAAMRRRFGAPLVHNASLRRRAVDALHRAVAAKAKAQDSHPEEGKEAPRLPADFFVRDYVVKIDVEGHELSVMRGARKWLAAPHRPRMLLSEVWNKLNITAYGALMLAHGYVAVAPTLGATLAQLRDFATYHQKLLETGTFMDTLVFVQRPWARHLLPDYFAPAAAPASPPSSHEGIGAWRGATVAVKARQPCFVARCPRLGWTQFTHWDSCDSVERLADAVKQPAGAKAILPAAARRQGFDVGRAEFFVRLAAAPGDTEVVLNFGQRNATEQQIDKRCDHGDPPLRKRLENCVDPRYPLRLPLAVHQVMGGPRIACYGRGDMVCDIVGRSGGWETELIHILSSAAQSATQVRRQQLAAHHAALLKHYGLAADDVPLPAAAAEGSFDVEYYDIGGNVGAFALSMQQHGYPTKVFEALPQNMQLLSTSKCLNGIRTSFFDADTSVSLVATEAGQDEPPLSPSVERAGRGDPLRLFHVALGEAADQRCVMLSTPLNFGDTFISCNRSHVESTSDTPLDDYVRRGYVEMTTADRVLHFGADDAAMRRRFGAPLVHNASLRRRAVDALHRAVAAKAKAQDSHPEEGKEAPRLPADFFVRDYVVKIDVEGHELSVMRGARKWLAAPHRPRMLLSEVWNKLNITAYGALMLAHGYVAVAPASRATLVAVKDFTAHHNKLLEAGTFLDTIVFVQRSWAHRLLPNYFSHDRSEKTADHDAEAAQRKQRARTPPRRKSAADLEEGATPRPATRAPDHDAGTADHAEHKGRTPEEGTARPANHVGAWRGATVARTAHRPCLVARCPRAGWTQFTHWDSCDSVERLADAVKQPAGAKAILPAAARRQGFDVGRAEFFVRPEVTEGEGDHAGFGQRNETEESIDKRCDHGEHPLRERLEGCVDPRYPLQLPLAIHHVMGGPRIACYGRGDMVCDIVGRSGGWETELIHILSKAGHTMKSMRQEQLAAHHAALLKHYGLAADDVPLPAAAAEGSFDVEFYDIGGNVGAFALSMQQHGYPTKVFEALPQNMQLLSTSKCLNGIRTSFFGPNGTAVPLVATEAGQDEPPLSPSVERAGRGDPLRLFHVALGEAADQRCVMLSTPLNFGDTFISCNRSHVESTSDTPLDDYVRRGYVEMTTADRVLHFGADDAAMRRRFGAPLVHNASLRRRAVDALHRAVAAKAKAQDAHPEEGKEAPRLPADFFVRDYVVKIDVEGHELSVMRGAKKWLAAPHRPRMLLSEVWNKLNITAYGALMLAHGYVAVAPASRATLVAVKDFTAHHNKLLEAGTFLDTIVFVQRSWAHRLLPNYFSHDRSEKTADHDAEAAQRKQRARTPPRRKSAADLEEGATPRPATRAPDHDAGTADHAEHKGRTPEEGTARPANHVGAWRGATVARSAHRPCLVARCPRAGWTQFTHWDSCDSVERLADAVKQPAGAKAILPAAARRQGFDVGRAEFFVRPEVTEGEGDHAGFGQRNETEESIDKRCDHGEHPLRERLEGCVDPRYPLRLPLAVHRLTVGANLVAYGRGDLVSDSIGREGAWENNLKAVLSSAGEVAKKLRRQQLAAHHAALLKHYGLAADDVPLPAAAAEGSFDVEYYDIGGNVGAFALSMQQHGYPTKVFEALPQNMQLLSTSKCLNGIRTSFFGPNGTAVPLVATEAGQDEPPLSPSVERAGRGDPLRLFHVALGEAADQRCVMLSTPLNFGDTFISCNRSHVESTSDTPLDDYVRRGYVEMTTADRVLHFGADDAAMRRRFGAPLVHNASLRRRAVDALHRAVAAKAKAQDSHPEEGKEAPRLPADFFVRDYVVKIDVEGHELSVMRGAKKWLAAPHRPRMLLSEVWNKLNITAYGALMLAHGYVAVAPGSHTVLKDVKDFTTYHQHLLDTRTFLDNVAFVHRAWAPAMLPQYFAAADRVVPQAADDAATPAPVRATPQPAPADE